MSYHFFSARFSPFHSKVFIIVITSLKVTLRLVLHNGRRRRSESECHYQQSANQPKNHNCAAGCIAYYAFHTLLEICVKFTQFLSFTVGNKSVHLFIMQYYYVCIFIQTFQSR